MDKRVDMNRLALAIILLLIALSPSAATTVTARQVPNGFLLASGKAGPIELGSTVDEIYKKYGRDDVSLVAEFREDMFTAVLKIRVPGSTTEPALSIDIREWPCAKFSAWGIDVRDSRFRTADGLGVGSTGGELRSHYQFHMTEAEGAHAAVVDALKMTFALDPDQPIDRARVTSVWLWPDPEGVRKRRCPGRGGL
jgi:hypothetical protein